MDRRNALVDIVRAIEQCFPDRAERLVPFVENRLRRLKQDMIMVRVCKHLVVAYLPSLEQCQAACRTCGLTWPRARWDQRKQTHQINDATVSKDGFRGKVSP